MTRNSYKYYLLLTQETIFSFAHSAFLTIKSFITSLPFIFFSLLTPSLSPPMAFSLPTDISLYLPLFSFFSLFLLPSITLFLNKVFFFLPSSPHRSINSLYNNFLYLSNYLYWISLSVKLFGICGILNHLKWNLWV